MLVAAAHPLTAHCAEQVLSEGGNAFDAAIAAALMACVTEPLQASLAGGGMLALAPAGQVPRSYDFYPRPPRRLRDPAELQLEEFAAELARVSRPLCAGPGWSPACLRCTPTLVTCRCPNWLARPHASH